MKQSINLTLKYFDDELKKKSLEEIEKLKGILVPGVMLESVDHEDLCLLSLAINYETYGVKRAKSRNAGPKTKNVIYYPDLTENHRGFFTYKRYFELSKTMSDIEIIKNLNINKATFYRRKKKMQEDIESWEQYEENYNPEEDTKRF